MSRPPGSIVVKRDGDAPGVRPRQARGGAAKALTRRPVADDAAERAADAIEAELRSSGQSEIPSSRVGALAMERLRALDHIAYIRFASVYQSFEDLEDLKREVDSLFAEGTPKKARRAAVSVLADRDIRAAARGRAGARSTRTTRPTSSRRRWTSTSTEAFRVFRNNRYAFIDPRTPQPDLTELLSIGDDEPFILHPGEFVLGQTLEWVELPDDLVARLEGRSSLGRLGLLIHSTAGYVDPGWKGTLTLELSNVANLPIALYYGMRIGQISFFRMSSPVERPYGSQELGSKYQGQSEPTASAIHADRERDRGVTSARRTEPRG